MLKISDIIRVVEDFAAPSYQESYDNAGLITGNSAWECTGALLCLDVLEDVVEEAIRLNCNLIIAHHPIVFSGLKKITGKNYVERVIIKAIKNDIAIYAAHTNLDNVRLGVNHKIAEKLGLVNTKILRPKTGLLKKLFTYAPESHAEAVKNSLFEAGGGQIGAYKECSFSTKGIGTFTAGEGCNPHLGKIGERHHEPEQKIEVIFPAPLEKKVLTALFAAHPYEEVAYEIIQLENTYQDVGSGMVGNLPEPLETKAFLTSLKEKMNTSCVRHTALVKEKIQTVALCGGAGSFLLKDAIAAKADIFITGDFKYHEFFDADSQTIIADIGHYESEQFTIQLFYEILNNKFLNFALHLTSVNTNPVKYI